jgi:hypothetical protein
MFSSGLMTLEIAERGVLDRLKSAVIGPTTRFSAAGRDLPFRWGGREGIFCIVPV